MTREQALELVEDLIQAHHDYETLGRRYREEYHEMKRKVIDALSSLSPSDGKTP